MIAASMKEFWIIVVKVTESGGHQEPVATSIRVNFEHLKKEVCDWNVWCCAVYVTDIKELDQQLS